MQVYQLKEVRKILGKSNVQVSRYVKRGKLRRLVPPGGVHGVYLKEEVDQLAKELAEFERQSS